MFNFHGTRNGAQRNLVSVLLNDSTTVSVGEATEAYTAGYLDNGVAALPLKGIVHAIVEGGPNNVKPSLPETVGTNVAGVANSSDVQTVTTAADNTTTKKYWALVDTSQDSLYSVDVNGTLGTTVDSDLPGCRIDVDSANTNYDQVLETTATRTVATKANFYSHGPDPADTTRLIVSLALPEELTQ
jgi:hypothetical protein